jgi:dihydroorotate dehydrogenase
MFMWDSLVRPLLFRMDPEWVHEKSMGAFATASLPGFVRWAESQMFRVDDARLAQNVSGVQFDRPLGLGAGFDKNARWIKPLAALGFGSIEIGTLTAHAQPGNDKPRLFRLPEDKAIINRMGFNNTGSADAASRLVGMSAPVPLGVNIGRSRITPNDAAIDDYLTSFDRLHDAADYFTVNVSSPNTAGLRDLQEASALRELLQAVMNRSVERAPTDGGAAVPVFVKIAPDLDTAAMAAIVELVADIGIAGIIATNTTISRAGLATDASTVQDIGNGGLSGAPLTQMSRDFVRELYRMTEGRFPIIGVGGIMTGDDAWAMIRAGATLLQSYSGFIYGGPSFARDIHSGLLKHLDREGGTLADHVGADA